MKVSCIMPTANRRSFVPRAIDYFLAQDYADKELIILDDGEDCIRDLVPAHPDIRYLRDEQRQPLGRKRNIACAEARGELIAHWDDDDWYAPFRLRRQVEALVAAEADICGIDRVLFFEPAARRAWEYVYPRERAPWVCGATLCYRKSYWRKNPFPEIDNGEDTRFVFAARDARIARLADRDIFVGMIHPANTDRKRTRDPRWHRRPIETVEALMRRQSPDKGAAAAVKTAAARARPAALVTAAYGIGDAIRMTPLIRVLHQLGHDVDFLLASDDPAALALFRGAPELRRLIHCPPPRRDRRPAPPPQVASEHYALATFTTLSAPFARAVNAKQRHSFARADWESRGDIWSAEKIARVLGWDAAMPAAFVRPSNRVFDLTPGTIALHPGCNPNWPWKKWHGFDALARLFPHVAIVGTESDLDNTRTYFGKTFEWPARTLNFVGKLDLADTAALISQCAALVANDSGLMHVGAALDIPTFGIFGITAPERELIPSPAMTPITKQLPCEPTCRRQPWGRRDCDRHLACLKTLTAQEVATRVYTALPHLKPPSGLAPPGSADISLNYYGHVFDASGYGQAARTYIHALHAAGVKVSVTNLGNEPPQVADDLVTSLLGNDAGADFNLLHGIPTFWPRPTLRLRNMIGMTVWETDTMPPQWREPLARAIDLWLPCRFNVEVFSRALARRAFTLPHALPPGARAPAQGPLPASAARHIRPGDFVFYSIFEWQDRKNPAGMIEAFLRAFPQDADAVLVLKSGPRAAAEAEATLARFSAAGGAQGRVVLCCETWSDDEIAALHARGDCYVSLHKGEGWGYPLFEAAARGKPVVATNYSGPRDYLDPQRHWLVRGVPARVRQNYQFYKPNMKWAEPDIGRAAEGLRWVHDNREAARAGATTAAQRIAEEFSIERVGALAKGRLLRLLARTNPQKTAAIARAKQDALRPRVPIPGEWFDEGYFERGLKSNWSDGYRWPLFEGVFRNAAGYLIEMFPEARSFLDVGCAKGFLVRALRERGLNAWGIDHSPWALAHADATIKPFLSLADTATAHDDRAFDVLIAMSLFEKLTEQQLDVVLPRARAWARQALFAVIPVLDESPGGTRTKRGRDLSQITLRSRDWWRERFRAAGWREDSSQSGLEHLCRTHPFPTGMGWNVHVLSPAN